MSDLTLEAAGDGRDHAPGARERGDRWDLVALVAYRSRQAFLDMVSSPEYLAIAHLRSEALTKGELHPLDMLVVTLDR